MKKNLTKSFSKPLGEIVLIELPCSDANTRHRMTGPIMNHVTSMVPVTECSRSRPVQSFAISIVFHGAASHRVPLARRDAGIGRCWPWTETGNWSLKMQGGQSKCMAMIANWKQSHHLDFPFSCALGRLRFGPSSYCTHSKASSMPLPIHDPSGSGATPTHVLTLQHTRWHAW
jgi:hypothetical protein